MFVGRIFAVWNSTDSSFVLCVVIACVTILAETLCPDHTIAKGFRAVVLVFVFFKEVLA